MPITAERLQVDVEADTSGAERGLKKFSRSTDNLTKAQSRTGRGAVAAGAAGAGMGRKFSAAATLVKAAAGTMIASFAGKTIMAASDLNEVVSKTGEVFGPQAKMVTDAAQEMADQFGMSKTVYLEAASGIGLVAKASGLTRKAAAGLSTDFAQLAADASSFYDVPVEEALTAMKSGLVGEAEPMRRFGVLLSEAAVKNEAYRLGIAATGAELTEGQKVQARSSLIMKGMSDASGDLARTQDSVANRLREIRGRITNFAADLGGKALPAVEWFLSALIKAPKVIGKMVTSVKEYLTTNETMKPVLDGVKTAVEAFITGVKEVPQVFTTVKDAISGFIQENEWVKTVLDQVALAVGAFVAAFLAVMGVQKVIAVIKAVTLAIKGLFLAMAANPVGLVIAAIVALAVVLYSAYQRFEGFRNVVNAVAGALKGAFLTAVEWVKTKWAEFGPAIKSGIDKAWNGIKAFLGWIVPVWKAQWTLVSSILKGVWTAIKGVVKGAINVIKGIINVVMGVIKGDWGRVWKGIQQVAKGVWQAIKGVVTGTMQAIKGAISGALDVIKAVWGSAWEWLKNKAKSLWDAIVNAVKNGADRVMNWVKGLPGRIQGAFSGAAGWLADAGRDIMEGLWNGLKSKWGDVEGWFSGITDKIPDLKGPKRKDRKLLVENGKAIMRGLKDGLSGEWSDVRKYLKALTRWVEKSFGKRMEKTVLAATERAHKRLKNATKRARRLARKYANAVSARDALVQEKESAVQSISGGITAQANVLNAGNNATTIRESLQAQVGKAKEFVKNLQAMAARGYDKRLILQVAGAGIEGGNEVAKALASANLEDFQGINSAFRKIHSIADSASKSLAGGFYDSAIDSANGLVKGLESKMDAVEKVARKMANKIKKALRKALKIKSPSRETMADGRDTVLGLVRGMEKTTGLAVKEAASVAKATTGSLRDHLAAGGPSWGVPGPSGGITPAATGGAAGRGPVTFVFQTYNPVAEPESRTTNKALDRVVSLGLV